MCLRLINLRASATLSGGAMTRFVGMFGFFFDGHWEGAEGVQATSRPCQVKEGLVEAC